MTELGLYPIVSDSHSSASYQNKLAKGHQLTVTHVERGVGRFVILRSVCRLEVYTTIWENNRLQVVYAVTQSCHIFSSSCVEYAPGLLKPS